MILYMVGKLAPNPPHFTRGLVKCVPGRVYFRAVPSQNGDKFSTSPTPPIVERLFTGRSGSRRRRGGGAWGREGGVGERGGRGGGCVEQREQ